MRIPNNSYVTIPAFMRNALDLKGVDLIIASLVYGFSQDGNSYFCGSTEYVADWAGINKKNAIVHLKKLTDDGIIIKTERQVNSCAKKCFYRFNLANPKLRNVTQELQNVTPAELQNVTGIELRNVTVYNIDNDNIDNNIINTPSKDFDDDNKDKLILFCNSQIAKLVTTRQERDELGNIIETQDYSQYLALYKGKPEYARLDMVYYFNAVYDWSNSANKRRTNRGWKSTINSFIRKDKEKGKLHLLPQYQPNDATTINVDDALEFLKM